MKTITRWVNRFFNLFMLDFNIRTLRLNEKEIAQQLHYLPACRQVEEH